MINDFSEESLLEKSLFFSAPRSSQMMTENQSFDDDFFENECKFNYYLLEMIVGYFFVFYLWKFSPLYVTEKIAGWFKRGCKFRGHF